MSKGVGISSLLAKLAARVLPTQVNSWRHASSEQQTPSLKLAQSSSQIVFDITKACIDLYPIKSHVAEQQPRQFSPGVDAACLNQDLHSINYKLMYDPADEFSRMKPILMCLG